jgi:hypothetical protein
MVVSARLQGGTECRKVYRLTRMRNIKGINTVLTVGRLKLIYIIYTHSVLTSEITIGLHYIGQWASAVQRK